MHTAATFTPYTMRNSKVPLLTTYNSDKKLSCHKETVPLLYNIEIGLTLKSYSADRPISIKPRAQTDVKTCQYKLIVGLLHDSEQMIGY